LKSQKLLLGPQIPKSTPHYEELLEIFQSQTSLDKFLKAAVFVVGILATSDAIQTINKTNPQYVTAATSELNKLGATLSSSGLPAKIKLVLIYVPLKNKELLVKEFDKRLKGLQ
jgi:hypothetical protein